MNAGGHGSDMAACLADVDVFDLGRRADGAHDARRRRSSACGSGPRRLLRSAVVVSARLRLAFGDREASEREIAEIVRWRREHQPGGQNCGSVFVNPVPDEVAAGGLIDSLGLRGFRIGTAWVSEKHANFIQAVRGRPRGRCAGRDRGGARRGSPRRPDTSCAARFAWSGSTTPIRCRSMTGLGPVNEGETVKPIADPRGREQQPDDAALDELRKAFGVAPRHSPVAPAVGTRRRRPGGRPPTRPSPTDVRPTIVDDAPPAGEPTPADAAAPAEPHRCRRPSAATPTPPAEPTEARAPRIVRIDDYAASHRRAAAERRRARAAGRPADRPSAEAGRRPNRT